MLSTETTTVERYDMDEKDSLSSHNHDGEMLDTVHPLMSITRKNRGHIDSNTAKSRRLSTPTPIKSRDGRACAAAMMNCLVEPTTLSSSSSTTSCSSSSSSSSTSSAAISRWSWGLSRKTRSAPDLSEREGQTPPSKNSSTNCQHGICHSESNTQTLRKSSIGDDCHSGDEEKSRKRMRRTAVLGRILDNRRSAIFAEALWDHVTLDGDELAFKAGEVVEVLYQVDKDWWYGRLANKEGWFPSTFVVVQVPPSVNFLLDGQPSDPRIPTTPQGALCKQNLEPNGNSQNKDQVNRVELLRGHKIKEILSFEKEYVKRLRDVVEGYVDKAKKRTDMFSDECISTIFGNISQIYVFAHNFLTVMESKYSTKEPHGSCLGQIFLERRCDFEIYSEYCNNHPRACEELNSLKSNQKYQYFFEACRLMQQMIEIPLEGYLLVPVQKICQYPLQLKELIKLTPPNHPDYEPLISALEAMKLTACLINERKRKMESLEKLAMWQTTIAGWQGKSILDTSSELIHYGEVNKRSSNGSMLNRTLFLFDKQLILLRKDILWKDILVYKNRVDTRCFKVYPWKEGSKDNPKYGFKMDGFIKDSNSLELLSKSYTFICKSLDEAETWLKAFQDEKNVIENDEKNGFDLASAKKNILMNPCNQKEKMVRKKSLTSYHSIPEGSRDSVIQIRPRKNSAASIFNFVQKNFKR